MSDSEREESSGASSPTGGRGVPFGRYRLLRKIATGGMAQLYLSTMEGEANFSKLCVVKKILPHLAEQPRFVDMFLDEARIAATLDHPNIVRIYDLGRVKSAFFIAMEYIAGEDLAHLQRRAVREERPLPIEICCRIIADLCAGLHYAHMQLGPAGEPLNIVHRDVSPQNVLVTYTGQVKIVDFGIAKAANKVAHTRTGTIMGKSAYMSPEQCLGQPLDGRSDIFAMGVLLFELLTGRRLFKRDNELLTMRAITEDDLPDVMAYRANLPVAVANVVERALCRDREGRFATAQEMREALERIIADFGVPATSLEVAGLLEGLFPDHVERQQRVREAGSLSEVIAALPSTGIQDLGTPSGSMVHTHTETTAILPGGVIRAWPLLLVAALGAVAAVAWLLWRAPSAGELVVASTPMNAAVRIDGVLRGRTPIAVGQLPLDRTILLEVSASGHTPHVENLVLTAVRSSQEFRIVLSAVPAPSFGALIIDTEPPGALVRIDGSDTGERTPARLEGVAADLEHSVHLSLDGYEEETRRVLLRAGGEQKIELALTKRVARPTPRPRPREKPPTTKPLAPTPAQQGIGFLTLRTEPWTRVFHGSVDLGNTPLFKVELPAGKVKLRLVNGDKDIDQIIQVTIEQDQVTTLDRTL